MKVDIQKYKTLILREESNRDQVPAHTLDWYTYENRVTLLKEAMEFFYPDTVIEEPEPKKTRAKMSSTQQVIADVYERGEY